MTPAVQEIDPKSLVARIIVELENTPEARVPLLRALLTDEFLLLPEKVDRLENTVAEHGKILAEHGKILTELVTTVSGLVRAVSVLETTTNRMNGQIGNLMGREYQHRVTRHIRSTANRVLRMRNMRVVWSEYVSYSDELFERIMDAEERGIITVEEGESVERADAILNGFSRTDNAEMSAVVEVSLTVDEHDVSRAAARAKLYQRIVGHRTVPLVIGSSLSDRARRAAEAAGVEFVTVRG